MLGSEAAVTVVVADIYRVLLLMQDRGVKQWLLRHSLLPRKTKPKKDDLK